MTFKNRQLSYQLGLAQSEFESESIKYGIDSNGSMRFDLITTSHIVIELLRKQFLIAAKLVDLPNVRHCLLHKSTYLLTFLLGCWLLLGRRKWCLGCKTQL